MRQRSRPIIFMAMVVKSKNVCIFFAIVLVSMIASEGTPALPPAVNLLSFTHYHLTCPNLESIIQAKTIAWVKKDPTLAASLIRLHFHDCVVRGCDASILLKYPNSERSAVESATLRGFEVIDDIKAAVEKACPRTVSCADIITTAARDATLLVNGPFWEVSFGRKDGRISSAKEAAIVPTGRESVATLVKLFESIGLNLLDLVILSGSHTIGRSTCSSIQQRLVANFNRTGKADPSIDPRYLNALRLKCKNQYNYVNLDVTTPVTFDAAYYSNLQKKLGLLATDQALYTDPMTSSFIGLLAAQPAMFSTQFAVSMMNLGNVGVLTRPFEGEIRQNCNFVNR